jgi:hypothetical protein
MGSAATAADWLAELLPFLAWRLATRMTIASTPATVSADVLSRPTGSCSRYATSGDRLGAIAAVIGPRVFDPYLEQIERDRDTDHCDEQRRQERRGELRLGAQPGQRSGDSEYQEEVD